MLRQNKISSHQAPGKQRLALALAFLATGSAALADELPAVTVTATRSSKPVNETPGASYVISAEEIAQRNVKTIDEALNLLPGVFQRRGKGFMDTLSEISLRGVPGGKRSLLLLDGLPLNDAYDNSAKLGGFAAEDLERIELALGPGSSLYGSSAMGGVVNFTSHLPQGEEYRFKIGYGNGLGSEHAPANLMRAYVSAGNAWDNGLSMIVSLAGTLTDGYASDFVSHPRPPSAGISGARPSTTTSGGTTYIVGERGDNAWNDQQFALRGKLRVDAATTLSASFTHAAYRYEYNGYQSYLRDAAGAEVWSYGSGSCGTSATSRLCEASFLPGQGEYARDLYRLGLDTRIGESTLSLLAGIVDVGTNWYTSVSASAAGATRSGGAAPTGYSQTPSRTTQLEATVNTPLFDRHLLVWGASWRGEKADTSEYDLSDWRAPDSRTALVADSGGQAATSALFAQFDLELASGVHAFAGARYDHWEASDGYAHNYAAGGFAQTYAGKSAGAVSPRLGAVWVVNPAVTLRASAGRAFRAPSIYDLYRTWKSSTTVYAGNPALTPETMTGYDLGGDFRPWSGGELKLTYFDNRFDDMIYRRTVTTTAEKLAICNSATLACQVWINAAQAASRGVEIALRQALDRNWSLFGSYTYNATEIRDNPVSPASVGKAFTQVPARMATLGAEWQHGDWSANGVIRHVAKRYSSDTNSDVVDGVPGSYDPYTLVDVRLAYRISRQLKAAVSIDNLTNRDYYASYRAPGRTAFVELSGEF